MGFSEAFTRGYGLVLEQQEQTNRKKEAEARRLQDQTQFEAQNKLANEQLGLQRKANEDANWRASEQLALGEKELESRERVSKLDAESRVTAAKIEAGARTAALRAEQKLLEEQRFLAAYMNGDASTRARLAPVLVTKFPNIGMLMDPTVTQRHERFRVELATAAQTGRPVNKQAIVDVGDALVGPLVVGKEDGGKRIVGASVQDANFRKTSADPNNNAVTMSVLVQYDDGTTGTKYISRPVKYWMDKAVGQQMLAHAVANDKTLNGVVRSFAGGAGTAALKQEDVFSAYTEELKSEAAAHTELVKLVADPEQGEMVKDVLVRKFTNGQMGYDAANPESAKVLGLAMAASGTEFARASVGSFDEYRTKILGTPIANDAEAAPKEQSDQELFVSFWSKVGGKSQEDAARFADYLYKTKAGWKSEAEFRAAYNAWKGKPDKQADTKSSKPSSERPLPDWAYGSVDEINQNVAKAVTGGATRAATADDSPTARINQKLMAKLEGISWEEWRKQNGLPPVK